MIKPKLHWPKDPDSVSGAEISPCGNYRTRLWRRWDDDPPLVFCMLNPSTADAETNDRTITRCIGFAKREKCGGIVVVNLSPYRTKDPKVLEQAKRDGVDVLYSAENMLAIEKAACMGQVVLAWGAGYKPWMSRNHNGILRLCHQFYCLGFTSKGHPRHPLMLRADTPIERFA